MLHQIVRQFRGPRILHGPAAFLLALSMGCHSAGTPTGTTATDVTVAAAANLNFALDRIVQGFEKTHPAAQVHVSYGSSGNFYSQLVNQAPFDLFLSADVEYPRKLTEQGLTLPGTDFVYAVGQLAIWVPKTSPIDVEKLQTAALQDPTVKHIAIANPQHAPYGQAAEAAMKSLGVYDAVQPKLVLGENIAQTLQFVQSGNADIGIVALALILAPAVREQGRFWELPPASHPPIDQGGVILKAAKNPAGARALRDFIMAPQGQAILNQYGYSKPGE